MQSTKQTLYGSHSSLHAAMEDPTGIGYVDWYTVMILIGDYKDLEPRPTLDLTSHSSHPPGQEDKM